MGLKKLPLLIFIFFLSGCFIADKKFVKTDPKDFPPIPQVNTEKQLYILPFENYSDKLEYSILSQSLADIFYSFIRFAKTYPFSPEMATLTNEQAVMSYFNVTKMTPALRKLYILKSIEMNSYRDFSKEFKIFTKKMEVFDFESKILRKATEEEKKFILTLYSKNTEGTQYLLKETRTDDENKKLEDCLNRIDYKDPDEGQAQKYLKLPEYFDLKVIPPLKDKQKVKEGLYLKGEITQEGILNIYLFDTILDKKIYNTEIPLEGIDLTAIQENKINLEMFILPLLTFLKKFSSQDFYQITIQKSPQDATFYVDNLYVDSPIILLPAGTHTVKAVRTDFEPYSGLFKFNGNSVLSVSLKKRVMGVQVLIETKPSYSPVFVNEKYCGVSPVRISLNEGLHQVRVSREGYQHENHLLKIYSFDTERQVKLELKKEKLNLEEDRKTIRLIKNFAFYSFFPFLVGHIYANEKTDYYKEKNDYYTSQNSTYADQYNNNPTQENYNLLNQSYENLVKTNKKYNNFNTMNQFFRNGSVMLLITAAIFQILDLQMDDIGMGIDQDKNLGIYIKW